MKLIYSNKNKSNDIVRFILEYLADDTGEKGDGSALGQSERVTGGEP